MNRIQRIGGGIILGVPRTRGDEPQYELLFTSMNERSPHPRG